MSPKEKTPRKHPEVPKDAGRPRARERSPGVTPDGTEKQLPPKHVRVFKLFTLIISKLFKNINGKLCV